MQKTRAAAPTHSSFGPRQPVCQLKACGAIASLSPGSRPKPLGTAEARQGEARAAPPVAGQRPAARPDHALRPCGAGKSAFARGALQALGRGTELPRGTLLRGLNRRACLRASPALQRHACPTLGNTVLGAETSLSESTQPYCRTPKRSSDTLLFVYAVAEIVNWPTCCFNQ